MKLNIQKTLNYSLLFCLTFFVSGCLVVEDKTGAAVSEFKFGNVPIAFYAVEEATLRNTGKNALPIEIIDIQIQVTDAREPLQFSLNDQKRCITILSENDSCQFEIHFAPQSVGDKEAKLVIKYYEHDPNQKAPAVEKIRELPLSGSGFKDFIL